MALSEGNIRGECGTCHLVYNLANHAMLCPRCKSTDILWATNLDAKEIQETWNPEAAHARIREDDWDRMHEARRKLMDATGARWGTMQYSGPNYPGRLSSPYNLTDGDLKDTAELMRMWELKDERD